MTDPLIGRVLEGRYRIHSRVAVGGMSTVYAAVDQRLDREVAVKVMASSLSSDPVFVDRFAREARTAAKLSHVNAVSVYDQGSDDSHVFLVMELVRGRTLRDLMRERGHLSPAESVSLMEPVLAALSAAHRAGLVHRDVKPENILLSDEGLVKVADFGLARAVETQADSTRTGLMMGTVAYSSPEQFRGSSADIRSDVYSAGIVLFELLTGRTPYGGPDAMSVAYQHVHSDVPPASSVQRGVPGQLDHLLRRATARDPGLRPPDAGSFLAELHDVRRELRLPVMPVPRRPRVVPTRATSAARAPQPVRPADPARQFLPSPPGPALIQRVGPNQRIAPAERVAATRAPRGGRSGNRPTGPGSTTPDPRPGQSMHHTLVHAGPHQPTTAPVAIPKRKRRWLRTFIGAVSLLVLCAGLVYGSWYFTSGRYSGIPDVTQQPASQARTVLADQGFRVRTSATEASDTVPKGEVISTDPPVGARQVRGRTVTMIVSAGPSLYAIPEVTGKTQSQAAAELTAWAKTSQVTVSYSQRYDDDTAQGNVISTQPAAGAQVRHNSTVTVYVSNGPPLVDVPNVVGVSQDDATSALTAAGFKVTVNQDYDDTVPSGSVISQNPDASAQQRKFSTVTIVVSEGPDLVAVPEISLPTSVDAASQTLEDAGFVVKLNKYFGGLEGIVTHIDPGAGTMLPRGSTITLTVY
jgi:beta-lactam-binding protein with PASTA domain